MSSAPSIDRRTLIGSGLAGLLAGCSDCCDLEFLEAPPGAQAPLGDAHTHLFNAADLPVAGFLRHVLLPNHLAGWEIIWPALIHLGDTLKSTLSMPAQVEIGRLASPWGSGGDGVVSSERFADVAADEIERQVESLGPGPVALNGADTDLAASYAALARLLEEADRAQRGLPPLSLAEEGGAALVAPAAPSVDRSLIARLAESGADAVPVPVPANALPAAFVPDDAKSGGVLAMLWNGIKWGYSLLQPRCTHVRQYLKAIAAPSRRTSTVINLLVDYTAWLDDGPLSGSGIDQQLRFWTRYARVAAPHLAVETFAPYDPLEHAESMLRGETADGYFAKIEQWATGGQASDIAIAGFKIYPPMGFKAAGNSGPPPTDRAGGVIRERWARHSPSWPIERFGERIEEGLDAFFELCAERNLPVLAHSRNSNNAWEDGGMLAHPQFWLKRIDKTAGTLRITLGHFNPDQYDDEIYRRILRSNAQHRSKIYLDISYADEILTGGAGQLLNTIADMCRAEDADCRWFMFGSDWIMLGQERHVSRYVPALLAAAHDQSYWNGEEDGPQRPRLESLLHRNLQRFLGRA